MQDKYIISFEEMKKAVIDAKNFGVPALLLINGEYYEISPDTIPNKEIKTSDNLPFLNIMEVAKMTHAEILEKLSDTMNILDRAGNYGAADEIMEIIAALKIEWNIED